MPPQYSSHIPVTQSAPQTVTSSDGQTYANLGTSSAITSPTSLATPAYSYPGYYNIPSTASVDSQAMPVAQQPHYSYQPPNSGYYSPHQQQQL